VSHIGPNCHEICDKCFEALGRCEEVTIGRLGDREAKCDLCGELYPNREGHHVDLSSEFLADFAIALGNQPKRVFTPEEHGVLDMVVEQGHNMNGDVFPKVTEEMLPTVYNTHAAKKLRENLDKARGDMEETVTKEAFESMDEQVLTGLEVTKEQVDQYALSAAERQQRFQDIADGGFTPGYVVSRPEFVGRFIQKELDHFKIHRVGKPTPGDPFMEGMLRHLHDTPFTHTVGWDANGSPTEEWP